MRLLLLLIALASTAGCLRSTEFKCTVDGDCTAMGAMCETTGYCSFPDMECAEGRRYGEFSGTYSNQCVGGMTGSGVDAMVDATLGNCPAGFATLPNAGTHGYKVTTDAASWSMQRDRCMQDGGYLAIPDDVAELQAITTATGVSKTWIGISDTMNEGTYRTVKGDTATFPGGLPWNNGEPGGATENCVSALMASPTWATDGCNTSFPAVCECDP